MYRLMIVFTAVVLSIMTPPVVSAREAASSREQRVEELVKRLNLTDAQKEKVQPVLEKTFKQREEIMKRHGVDPADPAAGFKKLRPREKIAMRKEMQTVDSAVDELKQILTAEQLDTLKGIQTERRAEVLEGRGAR